MRSRRPVQRDCADARLRGLDKMCTRRFLPLAPTRGVWERLLDVLIDS